MKRYRNDLIDLEKMVDADPDLLSEANNIFCQTMFDIKSIGINYPYKG